MDGISEKGRLLDIAKNKSEDIINSYESSSLFYLLTNNSSSNYPLNKEDITQKITELETNGNIRSIVEILNEKKLISKNRMAPIKRPRGRYFLVSFLIFSMLKSNIIITNKNKTATAPT